MFAKPVDMKFEDVLFMGPTDINRYLELRYGNYMKIPPEEEQNAAIHAEIYDTEAGFDSYL